MKMIVCTAEELLARGAYKNGNMIRMQGQPDMFNPQMNYIAGTLVDFSMQTCIRIERWNVYSWMCKPLLNRNLPSWF